MKGHKKQLAFFETAVKSGRLSHAYILEGIEGTGKKLFAKELARSLLCEKNRFFEECSCLACKQINEGVHPDVHIFENKEDLNIETVRSLPIITESSSYSGKWKIVIFDNVHVLSAAGADAANALLKTLEEPGENTVFFLITHKLQRVIPTILSRCQLIQFDPLSNEELTEIIGENISAEILKYSCGSVLKAQKLEAIKIVDIIKALDDKNTHALGTLLLGINNKDYFTELIDIFQIYCTDMYKSNQAPEIAFFIDYLITLRMQIDYNVNMQVILLDFFVKLSTLVKNLRR